MLSASPTQSLVASSHAAAVQQLRPDPPPWTGTVEHVVFGPSAGTVGAPTVLLDGVVATAGQALVDGGGQVQLVMKDHDCHAYDPWAARIATIDPAAL